MVFRVKFNESCKNPDMKYSGERVKNAADLQQGVISHVIIYLSFHVRVPRTVL